MKYLRITKHVPAEGLKAGDVVHFMSDAEADKHVAAEAGVVVVHELDGEQKPTGKFIEPKRETQAITAADVGSAAAIVKE